MIQPMRIPPLSREDFRRTPRPPRRPGNGAANLNFAEVELVADPFGALHATSAR